MHLLKKACLTLFLLFIISPSILADDCRKAVELYNRGTLSRDFNEKERLFKQALSVSCRDNKIVAKFHNNLADTYENKGQFEEAIAEYKRAIELDPDLPTPYFSLGDIYSKLGNLKLASEHYDTCWKLNSLKTKDRIRASLSLKNITRAILAVPSEDLYFGFDESTIAKASEQQLSELLSALNESEFKSYRFQLAGHTCSIGSDSYNQRLSERRAEAVKKWLVAHGHPSDRLVTIGFGKRRPIADNRVEEGRRLNRRVEIRTIGLVITEVIRSSNGKRGMDFLGKGHRFFEVGKYNEAVSAYENAFEVFKEIHFRDGLRAAAGSLFLAYQAMGEEEKAQKFLNKFHEIEDR